MYKFVKVTPKIVVSIILLFLILIILNARTSTRNNLKSSKISIERRFEGEKIVHLDLKGAPFKVSYYDHLFSLLAKLGATGVLIEYEDMFPYSGPLLSSIPAYNAYNLSDIFTITASAKMHKLAVIPLIQTFGHMEFILKLKTFSQLREVDQYPQVICPTHKDSLNLILEMVHQIVKAHPGIEKIHIGCDEVWYLGECTRCKNYLDNSGKTKKQLFVQHVMSIIKGIKSSYPKLRVLMWDDHFRNMSEKDLLDTSLGSIVEPVIWKYTENVAEDLPSHLWGLYSIVFSKVWIASAFKGATGSKQYLHNFTYHINNHKSWLKILDDYSDVIQFEGILLTGWQRYDHFAVLCELLPVSLPTLAMCLRLLLGHNDIFLSGPSPLYDILECESTIFVNLPKCHFTGSEIQEVITEIQVLKENFESMLTSSKVKGWVDNYNIQNEYSNPYYVKHGLNELEYIKSELLQFPSKLYIAMEPVYDNYTINEWSETYLNPLIQQVVSLYNAKEKLLSKEYWPKRPFPKKDLK